MMLPSRRSRIGNRRSAARRRGLTLMELLVSVAIISGMIAGFSLIVVQSEKLVKTSTATIRANQAAASIAHIIREDLSRLTMNGFLAVNQPLGYLAAGCAKRPTDVATCNRDATGVALKALHLSAE